MDPSRLRTSQALHARARAFSGAFVEGKAMPESFDALACDLARFQAEAIPGYARLCSARGVDPRSLTRADDIPAVPTDAFKVTRVATFDEVDASVTFRTSGTTQGTRGVHMMRDVSTYDAAAVAFGRTWLARDAKEPLPTIILSPRLTDSSLIHMCAAFAESFGEHAAWIVEDDVIDLGVFDERVARALAEDRPMLVLGASFAFVHLLEALGDSSFRLPRGSRVMQTGGYKGKSREVPKARLRAEIARAFAIPERAIVAEYGMTELSSQFYERTLFDAAAKPDVFAEPPWARVMPVDPDTLAAVPEGELGIAKILDLANVDSAVAVLTQDQVRRVPGGFELIGRMPGATPRGCSIAIDEILGR